MTRTTKINLLWLGLLLTITPTTRSDGPPNRLSRQRPSVKDVEGRAMADSIWVSADGNLNAAGSYSPSGVPGLNASLFFDGTVQTDVSTNLDAFSAVDKTKIWLQSSYDGNVGADGTPLFCPIRYLVHNGGGSLYHKFDSHAAALTYIVIDSPNQQDAYTFTANGATGIYMSLINGGASLANGAGPIGRLLVGSRDSMNFPIVNIGSSFGNVTFYYQRSGIVTTKSDLGTSSGDCVVDGGYLIVDATCADTWNRIAIAGGFVQYNGTGTLTECVVMSGTLDMTNDSRAKTITTLILMPGSVFLTHENVTVTNTIDLRSKVPVFP